MTITREYFNRLLLSFDQLCKAKDTEIREFIFKKNDLDVQVREIETYHLFELNLNQEFSEMVSNKYCLSFDLERATIVQILTEELYAILLNRLWYGGELMFHLNRIKVSLLHLPTDLQDQINERSSIIKYSSKGQVNSSNTSSLMSRIQQLETVIHAQENKIGLGYTKISKDVYSRLLDQINDAINSYKSYINKHYLQIADQFLFSQKMIRAYLCDERNDMVVLRVQSYFSNSNDYSITLDKFIHDFSPRVPYSLEKIENEICSWTWFSIQKSNYIVDKNIWAVEVIHQELLNIFVKHATDFEILKFVTFLYRCKGTKIDHELDEHNIYTIIIIDDIDFQTLIFIFHHAERSFEQIDLLINGNSQRTLKGVSKMLFTSKPDDDVINYLNTKGVQVLYLHMLTDELFQNRNSDLLHLYISSRIENLDMISVPHDNNGKNLIDELKICPLGLNGWSSFEKIGSKVFEYLFADSFTNYTCEKQSINEEDSLRRDLIVMNNFSSIISFWGRVHNDYKAKILIVEFKNYKDEIDYDTMYSSTKYLQRPTGYVVLIFSRKGGGNRLLKQQLTQLREGKLILCFDDRDLIEMIEEKINSIDPIYRLDNKLFNLLKNV